MPAAIPISTGKATYCAIVNSGEKNTGKRPHLYARKYWPKRIKLRYGILIPATQITTTKMSQTVP